VGLSPPHTSGAYSFEVAPTFFFFFFLENLCTPDLIHKIFEAGYNPVFWQMVHQ
jgi:hypothetical protein